MTTTICTLICAAMVITSIVEFAKPSFIDLVKKKYVTTICIAMSFVLGLIASFSFDFGLELNAGMRILLGLSLGTGATLWYDIREVVQKFTSNKEK